MTTPAAAVRLPNLAPVLLVAALLALLLAVASLPLELAVILVAGAVVVPLAVIRPEVVVVALAFAIPFGSVRELQVGGVSVTAADPLVGLLLVSWLLRVVARRELRLNFTLAGVPTLVFLVVALYSASAAPNLALGLKEAVKWAEFAIVFWFVASELRGPRWRLAVVVAIVLAATLQALAGWYQFAFQAGPAGFVVLERFLRAYGTFGQPNPFAGYLNTALLTAAGVLVTWTLLDRRRLRSPLALGLMVAAGVIAAGVAMSFSRGAWLAAAVAGCATIALADRRSLPFLTGGLVALMLVGLLGAFNLLPGFVAERLNVVTQQFGIFDARQVVVTPENYALVERMATWQAAWEMFEAHRLTGVGIGNFDEAYPDFALRGWIYEPGHAHNVYLNSLAETGVIGASAFLLFLAGQAAVLGRAFAAARRHVAVSTWPLALAVGVSGAWIAVAVHNGFDNLYVAHIFLQLAILLGLCAGLDRELRTTS